MCHSGSSGGSFNRPFRRLWDNFHTKGPKIVSSKCFFWCLWRHFSKKSIKRARRFKWLPKWRKLYEKVIHFWSRFWEGSLQKHVENLAPNRRCNRSLFYRILDSADIEKVTRNLEKQINHGRLVWNQFWLKRRKTWKLMFPRRWNITFGSHFCGVGDIQIGS